MPAGSLLEQHVVAQARAGSREAFETLVRSSARLVFCEIIVRIRDRALAEDLTQETFLKAWRSIASLEDPARFRGWLLTVARSVTTDHLRRWHPEVTGLEELDPAAPESSGEVAPEHREQQQAALHALGELPERYRVALALRYLSGNSHAEICQQMGTSDGALRGLLNRGLLMLRDQLQTGPVRRPKPTP